TLINSKFGKPSSFCPWAIPSALPNSLVATQTTSSHVNVDVAAGISPFSIFWSIPFAFFAFGSKAGEYNEEDRNTLESMYCMSLGYLVTYYFFEVDNFFQFWRLCCCVIFCVTA